ncbi:MAG: hypothetical protein FWD18_04950 [Micrococcales bacterium]|nr:hypothetical protein [Micrococcales bacterium]
MGITPVRALAEQLGRAGREVTVVHRARDREHAALTAELEALADDLPVTVHVLLGPWPDATTALTPAMLAELTPTIAGSDVFFCGSPAFMTSTRRAVLDAGASPRRVRSEIFSF